METLDQKLTKILLSKFAGEQDSLDFTISKDQYVSGTITSHKFADKDNFERQQAIWHILDEELLPEEKTHIVGIITLTPEELATYK